MPREKFQALTEQMFYILLCLRDECCGMDIMTKVEGRRRSYILTSRGRGILDEEYRRICHQVDDYRLFFGKEENQ